MMGLVDLLRQIDLDERFSGLGLMTVVYAVVAVGLLLGSGKVSKAGLKAVWPFLALVVWALSTVLWYTPSISGTQNILCLVCLVGLTLLAADLAERQDMRAPIERFLPWGVWCAAAIYGVCMWTGGIGSSDLMNPRSFGIVTLFGIAWYASRWRFGSRTAFALTAVLLVEIGASLSRVALVTGLVAMTLARVSATIKGWLWGLISLGLAIGAFWWMFNNIPALHDHFLSGDVRLHVGNTRINVSGRGLMWDTTYNSVLDSPWVGHGAGSAMHLMESRLHVKTHPHNDYLRVLHDYGVVGLVLWIWGWARLLWRLWGRARMSERLGRPDAQLQFAAFLSALSICLMMTTDNPMTYVFVMAPMGALVGAAIGTAAAQSTAPVAVWMPVPPAESRAARAVAAGSTA
jgi:hypothetical protein